MRDSVGNGAATRTLWLVSAAVAMGTMDLNIVTVAAHALTTGLRIGLSGLQWITNGYTLAFAALLLPGGSISDRYAKRSVFRFGVLVFTAGSASAALSPTETALVVSRVVQGAGAALVLSSSLALISLAYPDGARRQTALTVYSVVSAVAAAAAPVIGGVIVQQVGWRWIFAINIPVGVVVLLLHSRPGATETDQGHRDRRIDLLGIAAVSVGIALVNVYLIEGPHWGWTSPTALTIVLIGLLALCVVALRRGGLVDLSLLRSPSFAGIAGAAVLGRFCSLGLLVYLTLYLEGVLGYSALQASARLLLFPATFVIVSAVSARWSVKLPPAVPMGVGFALNAVGLVWTSTVRDDSSWPIVVPALVLLGVGMGLYFPLLLGVALDGVPPSRQGMASGLVNACLPLGTAVGVAVLGAVGSARIGQQLPVAALGQHAAAARVAYVTGLSAMTRAAALGAALAGVLTVLAPWASTRSRPKRPSVGHDQQRAKEDSSAMNTAPAPVSETIVNLATGFWPTKVLLAATELDLFTELATAPATDTELRHRLRLHPRPARDFLGALEHLGLIERHDDRYHNTEIADTYLVRGRDNYFGGFLFLCDKVLNPSWTGLVDTLRTGQPQNTAAFDPSVILADDPEGWENFVSALDRFNEAVADDIAARDWRDYTSFADIGGARGNVAARILQAQPHLSAVVLDLPHAENTFHDHMTKLGLQDRARFRSSDFFAEPLPEADAHIFGHVLHNCPDDKRDLLLRKSYDALRPGGTVFVYDQMINESDPQLYSFLLSLTMMIRSSGGSEYRVEDCRAWLANAGFTVVSADTVGRPKDTLVVARKNP